VSVQVLHRPRLFDRLRSLPSAVKAGVAIQGQAAGYGLVWEWGTVRIRPGPKTTYGSNPDAGTVAVFTRTAPSGYVRIHRQQFLEMAKQAVTSIKFNAALANGSLAAELQDNANKAMTEAAQLMAMDAPIDTGLLRRSINAISNGEVEELIASSYRPLLIGDFSGG
jgi:hypothetical protein